LVLRPAEIHPSSRIGAAVLTPLALAACLASLPAARRRLARALPLLAALGGFLAVNLLLALQPHGALLAIERLALAGAVFFVFTSVVEGGGEGTGGRDPWLVTLWALVLAGSGASLVAIYQKTYGFEMLAGELAASSLPFRDPALVRLASGRVFGTLLLPASLAGLLTLTLPASLALALRGGGSVAVRALLVAAALVQGAAFVATKSLGGIIALAVGVSATAWLIPGRGRRRASIAAVSVMAGVILLVGGLQARGFDWKRFSDPSHPAGLRMGNWIAGVRMLSERPLLGAGGGGYGVAYPSFRDAGMNESRHAHNSYLELAVEYGAAAIPMTLAICSAILALWWRACRRGRVEAAAAVGLIAFLTHNLIDFTAYQSAVLVPLAALAGGLRGLVPPKARAAPSAISTRPAVLARRPVLFLPAGALVVAGALLMVHAAGDAVADLVMESVAEEEARTGAPAINRLPSVVWAGSLCPLDPRAPATQAALLLSDGRAGEALEPARRALSLDPHSASLNYLVGSALQQTGDVAGALVRFTRAERLYPAQPTYRRAREEIEQLLARTGEEGSS
jgi:O-antigen ligase